MTAAVVVSVKPTTSLRVIRDFLSVDTWFEAAGLFLDNYVPNDRSAAKRWHACSQVGGLALYLASQNSLLMVICGSVHGRK